MFDGSPGRIPHDGVLHLFLNLVGSESQKTQIVFSQVGLGGLYVIGLLMGGIRRSSLA
jgi:uncharacterized membrane protein YuzA (DUF378 family)